MHIAILAAPIFSVPPKDYGPIELVISLLADGLVKRDVEVTLFALGKSRTLANLESVYQSSPWPTQEAFSSARKTLGKGISFFSLIEERIINFTNQATFSFSKARDLGVDLIHCHRRMEAFYQRMLDIPMLLTLHGISTKKKRDFFNSDDLLRKTPLVTISYNQRNLLPGLNHVATIYHGIDVDRYAFQHESSDYLVFFGRMDRVKGCSVAIDVARKVDMPLKIMGPAMGIDEEFYFKHEIEPRIDGRKIQYLGMVNHERKVAVLRGAKALLFPVFHDEAFGIVMIEAMACGTPVIAFRRGSAPEIINDGLTGFIVDSEDEMVQAVLKVNQINRTDCRDSVEKRFTADRMVDEYLKVYKRLLSEPSPFRKRLT
jgi:glycosyltransferase involved in cell wall biosynthesis